ncbi:MAG: hypothetical protein ACI3V3_03290 [Faecousia sp.]
MASVTELKESLAFWKSALSKLRAAYLALLDGGVKSYTIDDRQLTRFDLPDLQEEMAAAEKKVNELNALLSGRRSRKAFGVIPRDW